MVNDICVDTTYKYSSFAVNNAIVDSLSSGIKYGDIVTVEKDENGNVSLISSNPLTVNKVCREITEKTSFYLEKKLSEGIKIPFFAFSGITFLSGYGKCINYKTVTVSSVTCDFDDNFSSAGINQTIHSIYAKIICKVNVEVPFNRQIAELEQKVLICETVLIGNVPDIYLYGRTFD